MNLFYISHCSLNFKYLFLEFASARIPKQAFFDLGAAFGDSLRAFLEGTAAHVGNSKFEAHAGGSWEHWAFEANPKYATLVINLLYNKQLNADTNNAGSIRTSQNWLIFIEHGFLSINSFCITPPPSASKTKMSPFMFLRHRHAN